MPNLHGGKSYKKGKKAPHEKDDGGAKFYARDNDQDYARVIRMLGNRRVVCFCNDGYERVCKIRGALCKGPKRQKIDVGDIVFISFREFDDDSDATKQPTEIGGSDATGNVQIFASGRKEIADIIDKVHRDHWRHIKKETGIHKDLFFTASGNDVGDIFDYAKEEEEEIDDGDIDAI